MPSDSDAAVFMRRALELARNGSGMVHPNPLVGAVVVRDGVVVGEGYHAIYGGAHAEVEALRAAGAAARGATLYVTLEPCAHHGKTPPCTTAIIAAGIAEVVYAASDPNSSAGGGAALLEAAGITVRQGVERAAARALNAAFFHVRERGAPYVALKLAASLDQRIAAGRGARTAITGPAALRAAHRLRAGVDAILIGSSTAAVDDPLLTVRDVPCRVPPVRVVVDTDLRLDPASRLVRTAHQTPTWVLSAMDAGADRRRALEEAGVRVLTTARAAGGLDLRAGLRALAAAGARTILVEGGGRIASSLIEQDLVHRLYLFLAPIFLGAAGVPAFQVAAVPGAAWRFTEQTDVGGDVLLTLDRVEDG